MIEPFRGRVYDPCCGSGSLLVQAVHSSETHSGRRQEISLYGQEVDPTAWRIAVQRLASQAIEADLGSKPADTFHEDLHPDLRADFILANPPFNAPLQGGERLKDDERWRFGTPPKGNANFAWVQHFVHHLSPDGVAGFVLPNGSMSSRQPMEEKIRRRLVQADLVDCLVACPGQLFHTTQIPVCLWFLSRNKQGPGKRDRRHQVLFLDARAMGRMETRVHRMLEEEEISQLVNTYHAWRDETGDFVDVPGFAKSATLKDIKIQEFVLAPGRYVGRPEVKDEGEPFKEKMERLMETLQRQMGESAQLDRFLWKELENLLR